MSKTRFEKIPTKIFNSAQRGSKAVAREIASLIKEKAAKGENCTLGLATGSSPTSLYDELVRMHQEEGLSFKNVISFNLDEYFPMPPDALQSYVRFMKEHLLDLVDILPENIYIPDGTVDKNEIQEYCAAYEQKIKNCGGLDLQILGIGRTGHIGFNEPGSGHYSITRLISLDHITIVDAASDFYGEENVPLKAITMGVNTIMNAKRVILMAWGEGKAPIVKRTIEGEISDSVPATYLQEHPNVSVILDEASAAGLTRVKAPWLVSDLEWNEELVKRAVVWLSQITGKPILKLTNRDYSEYKMVDLVTEYDSAYNINIRIFRQLQATINGWPGGKPKGIEYTPRVEHPLPEKKRVIIFSPHPDDDVISMGGTFIRLVDHKHEVHVAYQTSGNIAVFDDDAIRFVDFVKDFHEMFGLNREVIESMYENIIENITSKKPGEVDSAEVQKLKALVRRGEAKAGCRYVGIPDEQAHFLDMPFYETGTVKKKPLGEEDIQITVDFLNKIKPHQIYAAGDLSDPHGTHRVCLNAITSALERLEKQGSEWLKECEVWLYRGAWQEWELEDIDMAVPISPEELLRKRRAIFKHQSQKDRPLFPGHDAREFWQRSESRNKNTAKLYDELGLPEYEAIEAFKRYRA